MNLELRTTYELRTINYEPRTMKEQYSLTGLQHKHYSVGTANKFLLHGKAKLFGPLKGSHISHQNIRSS